MFQGSCSQLLGTSANSLQASFSGVSWRLRLVVKLRFQKSAPAKPRSPEPLAGRGVERKPGARCCVARPRWNFAESPPKRGSAALPAPTRYPTHPHARSRL